MKPLRTVTDTRSTQSGTSISSSASTPNSLSRVFFASLAFASLLSLTPLHARADASSVPCAQIDPYQTDQDTMPLCPDVVKQNSASAVFRCAIQQTKVWHPPTDKERQHLFGILSAFKTSVNEGPSYGTTQDIKENADALGLQVCRVKNDRTYQGKAERDSYLLVYTKPDVRTYSGPFLMLRETNPSKVIVLSPHDGSDGTNTSTKKALEDSHALAVISNGHNKGITHQSDFVDHMNTLGAIATRHMNMLFPKSVFLHIHGMSKGDHVLYRSRSALLGNAFKKGIVNYTNIRNDAFGNFNAGYVTDSIIKSPFSLKTEIPTRIHLGNPSALGGLVRTIEENAWAWPSASDALEVNIDDSSI
jgi:hypothetical protein